MIIAITVLSIILIGVGFIVTENNANQLLTGYNTMPEEERQKFDIKSYITYFRNFHIFLGISLFVIGFFLYYFIDSDWSGIFMGTYPILAYVYFIWKSNKFSKQDDKKQNRKALIAMGIMIVVFTSIVFMFYSSLKDNSIEMNNQMINIQGDFGIDLKTNEVKSVELVNNLPNITSKVNGFALETILKGYFKTDDGEKVKLLINSDKKPVILITTTKDQKIYYSSKDRSNAEIYSELQKVIGNKNFR
jgi:hypothetical protein